MSYILDALRRAEAERERGAVPSLASQQHSIEVEDEAPQRSRVLVWAVIGLASALVATLAWTLLGGPGASVAPDRRGPGDGCPGAGRTGRRAAVAGRDRGDADRDRGAGTGARSPRRRLRHPAGRSDPAPARTSSHQAPAPRPVAAPKAAPAIAPPSRRRRAEEIRQTAAAPPPSAAAEPRIYAQSELPEDIRRELPRVAINGSSYSGDAASRMVMINGQVFHEGDQLSAGLVLDKIRRRSAVLAYKGFRYEVMF